MVKVERKVWNCMRVLQPDIEDKYEFLSNLIGSYGGRIHGSQYTGYSVAVYFEIPTENKEQFLEEEQSK